MSSRENPLPVSSASIILTHPTISERLRIWKATYAHWGTALAFDDYIARENNNLKSSVAANDGFTNWILTDRSAPDQRPILSSCETYRKRAIVCSKEGVIRNGTGYSVASVFTFTEYQGRGYAKKLMELLAEELRGVADFSTLWSDIGPKFYNSVGWKPFKSTFLQLPATSVEVKLDDGLTPINSDNILSLVKLDEKILREKLASPSSKDRVLVLPDLDTIRWHLDRESFMCKHIFSRTPMIHGVVYKPQTDANAKIWAIWTRNFYGQKREENTTHIIRLGIENENISNVAMETGIKAICRMAQKEADEWLCSTVEIWNPDERVKKIAEETQELGAKLVVRENDHLSSMQWFGEGSIDEIDWICNEGYAWC
ncbi:unnamed protein product [Penicillium salamii]|nr:unnamed protein product [Penicillium salamii]